METKLISIPVTYGEAFDKMSNLSIKYSRDQTHPSSIRKEYHYLDTILRYQTNSNIEFHYKILQEINKRIVEKEEEYDATNDIAIKQQLSMDRLEEEKRKDRVIHKINGIIDVNYRKCIHTKNNKKAFILHHLGLGDHITCMGIVRYYATLYDEVYVVCKKKYEDNVRLLYQDDITIHIYPIDTTDIYDGQISEQFHFSKERNATYVYNNEVYDLITFGMFSSIKTDYRRIPFCFYDNIQLDYRYFWDYSHLPDTTESKELYNELLKRNIHDYIIIHASTSSGATFSIKSDKHKNTCIIDLNQNIYDVNHPYYEIAEMFVSKPLLYYKDTIQNASALYLSDSCIFTLALMLPLKTEKCFIFPRSGITNQYDYIFTDYFKFDGKKTRRFQFGSYDQLFYNKTIMSICVCTPELRAVVA
jgi:hypothetical protein